MTAAWHPAGCLAAEAIALKGLDAQVIDATDIGTYAVEWAVRGYEVFPLRGKAPAIQGGRGCLDATNHVPTIIGWWSGRYAGCNIGVRVPESMFVLDVDGPDRHPHPGRGLEALAELEGEYEPLPPTLTQITGSGGLHLIYRRPHGKLSKKRLPAGLEYKDRGGYVVAAPSLHPDTGEQYVLCEHPVAAPPIWLARRLTEPERPPEPPRHRPRNSQRLNGWTHISGSVADTFSAEKSWTDILEPHGWRCLDADPDGDGARWLHPTATSNCSATVKNGCLFVYSSNTDFDTTEAGSPHGYTRFRAHAVLNHGGDLSAAARSLKESTT